MPQVLYSSSIYFPPKPLQKEEVQLLGGVGYFPETLPDGVSERMAFGGKTTIRYGFSNSFAVQLKGWYDFLNNVDLTRWGLILNTSVSISVLDNYTLNLRITGIKQRNIYSGKKDYYLTPSLNIGYIF